VENQWEICLVLGGCQWGVADMSNLWEQIKERLARALSSDAYQNWISRTEQVEYQNGLLVVSVPDETTRTWIEQEYAFHIREILKDFQPPVEKIEYILGIPLRAMAAGAGATNGATVQPLAEPLFENSASWLNPRLTFDSYVVGSSNQLAHAAAMAVSKMPSRS
jgi:chromosomal replication initiator protein